MFWCTQLLTSRLRFVCLLCAAYLSYVFAVFSLRLVCVCCMQFTSRQHQMITCFLSVVDAIVCGTPLHAKLCLYNLQTTSSGLMLNKTVRFLYITWRILFYAHAYACICTNTHARTNTQVRIVLMHDILPPKNDTLTVHPLWRSYHLVIFPVVA